MEMRQVHHVLASPGNDCRCRWTYMQGNFLHSWAIYSSRLNHPCFNTIAAQNSSSLYFHPVNQTLNTQTATKNNNNMVLRRRAQRRTSSHDDNERLLPAIELQAYPLDPSSPPTYNPPKTNPSSRNGYPDGPSPRNPLHRVATRLNLSGYIDALTSRPRRHSPSPRTIIRRSEEEPVQTISLEIVFSKGNRKHARSGGAPESEKTGLRSAMTWYFWAPPSSAKPKDCPTLRFLRTRLAPPGLWL